MLNKGKIIIIAMASALVVLSGTVVTLLVRGNQSQPAVVLEPDYAMIEIDEGATPMEDTGEEKPEVAVGGGSVTISFTDDVRYSISTGAVTLYYQNPHASTHNVVVQVILINGGNEYLLAQSGILEPGYELTSLKAEEGLPKLSSGGYNGKLRLLFYDPATGERAIVDTDIPCSVTVTQ